MTVETLFALATTTTSGTVVTAAQPINRAVKALLFNLKLTDAKTDAGDKLNVFVQHSPDGGTTWDDLIHFTEILGNGADAFDIIASINCQVAPESELRALADKTLAGGSVLQGPIYPLIRGAYIITKDADSPEDQSFTWGLTYQIIR
jgi:hypothetical protein